MTEQGKLRMEIALRDVEELFPFRFVEKTVPKSRIQSTVYRPSYVIAMNRLEKLIKGGQNV
jgi:hypothetical protein